MNLLQYRNYGRLWRVYGKSLLRYGSVRKVLNAMRTADRSVLSAYNDPSVQQARAMFRAEKIPTGTAPAPCA